MDNLHYYYNVKYLEEIASISKKIDEAKNDEEKKEAKNLVQLLNNELLKKVNLKDAQGASVLNISKEIAKKHEDTKLFSTFKLKTTYPGLLFGSGYPHLSGEKVDGELQVGFNFDYTSGVPYYPGSSLKGIIRHFIDLAKKNADLAIFITDGKIEIEKLEKSFDNDVFIGAYVTDVCGNNNQLMGIDYITPHLELKKPDDKQKRTDDEQKKRNELINPNPIPFIRINPDVVLEFFFIFKEDSEIKLDVYKKIITEFGVGAKTNVGYGRMTTYD